MRRYLALILCPAIALAVSGPIYKHEQPAQDEFRQLYTTLNSAVFDGGTAADLTITNFHGTATNDSACAGCFGEFISSSAVANVNFPATATYGDLVAIVLTPGDWEAGLNMDCNNASGVTVTNVEYGISTTIGNSSTGLTIMDNYASYQTDILTAHRVPFSMAGYRISLSTTTTYYLKYLAAYGGATAPFARGKLWAQRRR